MAHGKNTYLALDDAAGTLQPLTGIAKESSYSKGIDTAEASHYGIQDKIYVSGLSDATVSVSGNFDASVDAVIQAAIEAIESGALDSLTFVHGVEGNGTGKPSTTLEVIPTSYQCSAPVGDLVTISLSLQRTGPTVRGVFA